MHQFIETGRDEWSVYLDRMDTDNAFGPFLTEHHFHHNHFHPLSRHWILGFLQQQAKFFNVIWI